MSHVPRVLNAFSRLLSYPDEHTVQVAELLYVSHGEFIQARHKAEETAASS